MQVHAPDEYARKVGLRVLVVGQDAEPGAFWSTRVARDLEELPGVVWLLPGDLRGEAPGRLAWTWQALRDADLVVARLAAPEQDGAVPLVVGRALGSSPTIVLAAEEHPGRAALEAWSQGAGATLVREPEELLEAVSGWVRRRHELVPARALPESRELEELERAVRESPGDAAYEAYWRQLVRLGITDAEGLSEVRPRQTQGFGGSRWKTTCSLQGRRLSTLAPELGESRLAAPHGELPSEEREGDHHPDHFVILRRHLTLQLEDLTARLSVEARWDQGDWGEGGDAPEKVRPVLRDFAYEAEVPLVEAVADVDGWVARESRRAVVKLTAALGPAL